MKRIPPHTIRDWSLASRGVRIHAHTNAALGPLPGRSVDPERAALLARARAGNAEAIAELWRRYRVRLL